MAHYGLTMGTWAGGVARLFSCPIVRGLAGLVEEGCYFGTGVGEFVLSLFTWGVCWLVCCNLPCSLLQRGCEAGAGGLSLLEKLWC